MSVLALTEGALSAMFDPGGATEAGDAMLVRACLGDVVADGVGLAGVGDTAGAALAFGHHGELTVHWWAGQRPAVYLPLQTLALLAVFHPGVTGGVGEQAVLVETLAAETRVALRTAEQVRRGVVTVTHHPPAHHLTRLTGTDGAPIVVQHPDLPIVLDLIVMDTVAGTVVSVGAATVVASLQVETHGVVATGVPARFAFVHVYARLPIRREQAVVVVAITTLAVVPAGQVDADGFTVTLHKTIRALINVCLTPLPCEALLADTAVRRHAGSSVLTQSVTHSFAHGTVPGVAWFTGAAVAPHGVETEGILVTAV